MRALVPMAVALVIAVLLLVLAGGWFGPGIAPPPNETAAALPVAALPSPPPRVPPSPQSGPIAWISADSPYGGVIKRCRFGVDSPPPEAKLKFRLDFRGPARPALVAIALTALRGVETDAENGPTRRAWRSPQDEFGFTVSGSGRCRLDVVLLDGSVAVSQAFDVVAGETVERKVSIPKMEFRDEVLVRVLGPDGRTPADAEVQAGLRLVSEESETDEVKSFRRYGVLFQRYAMDEPEVDLDAFHRLGDDGTVRVRHDALGAPRTGPEGSMLCRDPFGPAPHRVQHFLRVVPSDAPVQEVVYDPVKDREVTVHLVPPARLTLTVNGLSVSPAADRLLVALAPVDRDERVHEEYEGHDRYSFQPCRAGEYELLLAVPRRSALPHILLRRRLSLREGANEAEVQLPRVSTVVFESSSPLDPGWTVIARLSGGRPERWTDGELIQGGRLRIRDLPDGRYRLTTLKGDAPGEMTFQVRGDAVITWAPRPWNALRVDFGDSPELEPELLKVGIRAEDLVLAVDDVELATERQPMQILRRAQQSGCPARLMLERGDRKFEVTVSHALLTLNFGESELSTPWVRLATR